MSEVTEASHRAIRSFVVRAGRMTDAQKRFIAEGMPRWGFPVDGGKVDCAALFQRTAPVILEIGFGMGQSLAENAAQHPQHNFIGIEVHPPGVGTLLSLIDAQQLTNIRIAQHDAVDVLKNNIADASLAAVQLFFPDPWHKKRHHKRRIVQPEFVKLLHGKLKIGGQFHMATDWQPYAEHMLEVMESAEGFANAAGAGCYSPRPADRPVTKFERRGERLGHGVWDLIYTRIT
jgi:tRNA (guanine-N7-)-methyltransferase